MICNIRPSVLMAGSTVASFVLDANYFSLTERGLGLKSNTWRWTSLRLWDKCREDDSELHKKVLSLCKRSVKYVLLHTVLLQVKCVHIIKMNEKTLC